MILDTLANADRYLALHPLFPRAFEFLRSTDLAALAPGRHVIDGESLFAIVEACPGRTRAEAKLECHRRYIDIQLVLEGTDEMGWKPLGECRQPVSEFNVERDIRFSTTSRPAGSPRQPAPIASSSPTTRTHRW
jgi:biofilm protein TabA